MMAEGNQPFYSDEFGNCYKKYKDWVFKVAWHHLGNVADAEDVCQRFFLRALEKSVPRNKLESPKYRHAMIRNDIIDNWRSLQAEERRHIDRPQAQLNSDPYEDVAIIDEFRFIMENVNKCLSKRTAETFRLRYINDYTDKRIAEKMSIKKKTVIRTICIGIRKLRKILGGGHSFLISLWLWLVR